MLSSSSRNQDSSHESSGDKQPSDVREESMNSEEMSASDPGLDWFHSLTSPAEGDSAFPASPIRSSRQYNAANALCSGVLPSNKGSAHGASAWEKQADEGGGSVVQKTSKTIRSKRLKEMNEGRNGVDGGSNADRASSTHELPRHSTPMVDRKRPSEGKAPSFSPALMEQPENESLQVDLSSFTFRPRERMTHLDQTSCSDLSPETNITHHKIGTKRILQTKRGEKKEREQKQKRCSESPAEGSSACKKLRVRVQPEVGETPSEKSRQRNITAGDAENKRQQLVNSLRSATPNESGCAAQPHQPKPKVASSTLAKLSAFSFVPSPEENASHNLTAAPTQANNTPVSKDGVMENGAGAAEHKGSMNSATETCQKTSRPHARTEMCEEQAASFSKRKCFELSSARPGTLFSGLSFFSSSILEDEAPDVDWEEESRKKVS